MDLQSFFKERKFSPKEKTQLLKEALLNKNLTTKELIKYAKIAKAVDKGSCVEALEFASKISPSVVDNDVFKFLCDCLLDKAPRVQWESAKVIGNVAAHFQNQFNLCIPNLLINSEKGGTVVRWSAAFALAEIIKTKHISTLDLIPVVEAILLWEEKNSIRKIYDAALKKVK